MEYQTIDRWQSRRRRVKRATVAAASMVNDLVFSYGHLAEGDPEREILKSKISEVLARWAHTVRAYGAVPMDLWTVRMKTPEGFWEWQYPCSSFVEAAPRSKTSPRLRP